MINFTNMKKITINIPDDQYDFFIELVKNLGLENVTDENGALLSLEKGFEEIKQIESGQIKGTSLKDFINEL